MPTVLVQIHKKSDQSFIETKIFTVDSNAIIYDALESQDFVLPHGCLAGSCGSCRIEVLKGKDSFSEMSAVEKDTVESLTKENPGKDLRLSCRARIKGDIEIKIYR